MEVCSYDELHAAITNNCLETAKYLINTFGKTTLLRPECKTLRFAIRKGNNEIIKLLLINGSQVNCKAGVTTPLHVATKANNVEIIKLLLERCAKINVVNEDFDRPLHFAAGNGNKEIVELFLGKHAEINAQNKHGSTSLYVAIEKAFCWVNARKHLEVIELLLKRGACVNKSNKCGNTPLHVAVQKSASAITELLLSKNPKVNSKNNSGKTPLHFAVINNDMKVPRLLLNRGACIDAQDNNGETPLHNAIENKRINIIRLFLRKCCRVNIKNKISNTPLHLASKNGYTEIVEILLDRRANINALNRIGYTALHYAVVCQNKELTKLLINRGAHINAKGNKINISNTPLHLAVKNGYVEFVEILLDSCADINAVTKGRKTPLHCAIERKCMDIIILLLNRRANVNAREHYENTPLHLAVKYDYTESIEILLDRCADINAVNKERNTPLHCAILINHMEVAKMLLNRGACVNVQNNNGKAPLHCAIEQICMEIIKLLLNCRANVNARDHKGNTPLHDVINKHSKIINRQSDATRIYIGVDDKIEIVKMLLHRRADINAVNKNGNTPLNDAIANKDVEVAKFLINQGAHVNAEINNGGKAPLHILIQTYIKMEPKDIYEIVELVLNKYTFKCNARNNFTPHSNYECETIVKLLLDRGAFVDAQDEGGATALDLAIKKGEAIILKCIINAYPDIVDKNYKRCLNIAINRFINYYRQILYELNDNSHTEDINYCKLILQNEKFTEVLLEYSININSQVVPLHFAALAGSEDICTMLLNQGANINQKENGITALHIAIINGYLNLVDVLLKNGAEFGSEVKGDMTRPIHIAAERGDALIVETLLKFGADANCRDKKNMLALHIAYNKRFFEVVLVLLKYGADIDPPIAISSANRDIGAMLEKALLRGTVAKLRLNERNQGAQTINELSSNYYTCCNEIEKLKTEMIYNNITFYDIVTKDVSRLATYARNENIKRIVKSGAYREKFPEYADVIDSNFKKGEIRVMLNSRVKSLDSLSGYQLPHLVTEQIFSYLSNPDLENLIDACPNNVAFRKSLAADRLAIYARNDHGNHSQCADDDINMD